MRHGKKFNHLSRKSAHRNAMLSNMAVSLITHKRIKTTVAKAKALKKYVEPLITRSKEDTTHSRRVVFSYLQDKNAVTELFRDVSQKVADRPGGYTRILRTGFRAGDGAEMCIIELVDYNENYSQNKGSKKTKTRATRRSRSKKTDKVETPTIETQVDETVKDKTEDTVEKIEEKIVEEVVAEEVVEKEVAKEELVEEVKEEKNTEANDTPAIETEETDSDKKEKDTKE